MAKSGEIMTLPEASEFLRMSEAALRSNLKKRAIPGSKVAGRWLFSRRQLLSLVEGVGCGGGCEGCGC